MNYNELESLTVTLTLDNDEELECEVLTVLETEGQSYIALSPTGGSDEGQVYLYRLIDRGEDEEPDIENITDDDEFERVSAAFDIWAESLEFGDIDLDELDEEEETE